MHFSFSTERFKESRKYRNDIEHDASMIGKTYRETQGKGLFDLTHSLAQGKECGMKLVNFEFSSSSQLQYLMAVRNVRCEMIRVIENSKDPDSSAIVGELNRAIRESRELDGEMYSHTDISEKAESTRTIDFRKDYEMLVKEYPAESEATRTRVPINVNEEPGTEFTPFLEDNGKNIVNEKRRDQ